MDLDWRIWALSLIWRPKWVLNFNFVMFWALTQYLWYFVPQQHLTSFLRKCPKHDYDLILIKLISNDTALVQIRSQWKGPITKFYLVSLDHRKFHLKNGNFRTKTWVWHYLHQSHQLIFQDYRYLLRFMKFCFTRLFFIQLVIVCLGFLFSQP